MTLQHLSPEQCGALAMMRLFTVSNSGLLLLNSDQGRGHFSSVTVTLMTVARLSTEQRRALELLASSRHGINEVLLARDHGFSRVVLGSLVRRRLVAREPEVMMADNTAIKTVRTRITAAGRRAIEGGG
jgi:hypothetical protein